MPILIPGPRSLGASLSALELGVLDLTDGSWTTLDVDALLKSPVTFAAGVNTVTMAALGVGSSDYDPISGSNHRYVKYHKPLLDSNGDAITSDDTFAIDIKITGSAAALRYAASMAFGACVDPTSTVGSTVDAFGGCYGYGLTGNNFMGTWQGNTSTSGSGSTTDVVFVRVWSRNTRVGSGSYITEKTDAVTLAAGSRNANSVITAATPMHLICGIGTKGAQVIADGSDMKFKAEYLVTKYL